MRNPAGPIPPYNLVMPIFEYNCQDCGTDFEKLVRGSSTSVVCPNCGHDHLTTRYSTFAAHNAASTGATAPSTDCGAGACGSGMCGTGMCGMNFN